jgi:hypothetical protein
MLPRSLPALLVSAALAAMPSVAAAGLGVGGSAPFDPTRIRAVRSQEGVAAAANATVTLFAWTDFRSGNADVYAARVRNSDGAVLDPNGIPVAVTGAGERAPAVSWNGSEWLVVWEREATSILATRVAPDGEVLDPSGIPIASGQLTDIQPAAAGLGAGHAVVWSAGGPAFRIFGAIVDSDGSFDVAPTALAGSVNHERRPALAVRGTTALVAFTSDRNGNNDIFAFRFQRSTVGPPALVRLDASDLAVAIGAPRVDSPAAGASATAWLVAWTDSRNAGTGNDIYASRVNSGGTVQDPAGIQVSSDAGNENDPAVHHDGSRWLVAWSQHDAGQFLRVVANNGNPAAARIDVSTASGTLGEAAFGGDADEPIVAWSDPEVGTTAPNPPQDLLGRLVAANLSLGTPFVIATQTPNQTQPALAFGGGRWFVAWVDDRYGPTEGRLRYAVTDSQRFEAPAPAAIQYVAERPGLDQQQPTACFDGSNFNLFWTEERGGHHQVFGARFDTTGAFVDSFVVTSGAWDHRDPTCTRQTGPFLIVAWTDARLPGDLDIWGRQVLHGTLYESEEVLADEVGVQEDRPQLPARIVDPGDYETYLVYQLRKPSIVPGNPDIRAIRGRHVYTYSSPFFSSSEDYITDDESRIYESPRIAWNGENWLATYHELVDNDGSALYIPWANWIGPGYGSFHVEDADSMAPGSYVPANPIPGSTGHNFLAQWSDRSAGQVDLYLRRADGTESYVGDAIQHTADAGIDVPGAALGHGDRVGFAWLPPQNVVVGKGRRLFGAEARDTLVGRVVINEFLANPPMGAEEFVELVNVSGQTFNLEGWFIVVNGDSSEIQPCAGEGAVTPGPDALKRGFFIAAADTCAEFPNATYHRDDFDLDGITGTPEEGRLPNRGGHLELFAPSGVRVDEVAYGFLGGAPVSPAIPTAEAPVARAGGGPLAPHMRVTQFAPGDSVAISTARLPDGTDTDNDANDFNLTNNTTSGSTNVGTAAALGTSLFLTQVSWNPPTGGLDAVEIYNPLSGTADFSNWYLGSNDGTQRIGVPGNQWSILKTREKQVLRRNEGPGTFSTDLDYLTVVYLLDPNFTRVEQLGWSHPDNVQPQLCIDREPDEGAQHNGFDWLSSGGLRDPVTSGELRYVTCAISDPAPPPGTTPVDGSPAVLAFRGAVPNPLPAGVGALVFSVPGVRDGAPVHVRLRLIDVAGRARATLVDGSVVPGEHRVALTGAAAGIYYAELEVGGRRLSRPVVVVP